MNSINPRKYSELHWTEEMVNAFWGWQSLSPENYFTYNFGEGIVRTFRDRLRGRTKILDYGCGVGYLLPHLCRYASSVYGADVSDVSVNRANERVSDSSAFQGAFLISDLRRRGEKFDAIFVVEVIEHLYDDVLGVVMDDVRNLLADGGVVIFTTPNNEDRSKNMVLCPVSGQLFHRWQHVRSWSTDSLAEYLIAHGFEVRDVSATNFQLKQKVSPVGWAKRLVKRILFGHPGTPHLYAVAALPAGQ